MWFKGRTAEYAVWFKGSENIHYEECSIMQYITDSTGELKINIVKKQLCDVQISKSMLRHV